LLRPNKWKIFCAAICWFTVQLGSVAQGHASGPVEAPQAITVEPQLLPGVVLEKDGKYSQAKNLGMREGDVLLGWSRGDEHGKIESPFDISWLDIEQRPRGIVKLSGRRGSQLMSWEMGDIFWYLDVRPNFSRAMLADYNHLQRLSRTTNPAHVPESLSVFIKRTSQLPWLRSWLLLRAGNFMTNAAHWQQADDLFAQAAEQASLCDPRLHAEILAALAIANRERPSSDMREEYYQKALAVLRKLGVENLSMARALMRIGFAKMGKLEDLPLVEDHFLRALAIQQKLIPGRFDVSLTLSGLGETVSLAGETSRAKAYLLAARAIVEPHGETIWLARISANQSEVAFAEGDMAAAESYAQYAVRVGKALDPRYERTFDSAITMLGVVFWYRGDFDNAEKYSRWVMAIEQKVGDYGMGMAYALDNLGAVMRTRGRFAEAKEYFDRSIKIGERLAPNGLVTGRSYGDLATLYYQLGDLDAAEKYFERALAIEKALAPESLEVNSTLNDLGALSVKRGRMEKALQYYREAEKMAREDVVYLETIAALAQLSSRNGKLDEAEKLYKKALKTIENQAAHLGGSDQTRSAFRANHGDIYRGYANLLVVQGKFDLAFNVLEHSRARSLLETLSTGYIDVHKGANLELLDRERSLRADLNGKSERRIRLMEDQHSGQAVNSIEKEIADLLAQYQEVESQIRATSPAYAALTQPQPLSAKEVRTQLLDPKTLLLEYSLGEERSYVFAVTPDSLEAFELPKRTEIEKAARSVYSLLTARNTLVKNETPAQRNARLSKAEAKYPRATAELSKMILGPVAAQLKDKRLLIVTDGALAYIPFSTLPEPANKNTDASAATAKTTTEPLIVNHEIVNLPSASVLAVLRQQEQGRKPAPNAVAVLADPVFDRTDPRVNSIGKTLTTSAHQSSAVRSGQIASKHKSPLNKGPFNKDLQNEDSLLEEPSSAGLLTRSATDIGLSRNGELQLPRLRFTRKEADEIMAVTPAGAGKKAVDFDASRATATSPELSQYRIVHFATHGLLDSAHPELSGLVFSMVDRQGHPQNGFLELQDIYNLNLPADLVVLSACETGLGKEISGEGLVGLTRGFMYAGATRVVASLWRVSDVGTAELMTAFYTSMEKDGLPPAAALRAAQIKLIKQKRWSNPYYWAAFQIQGEWK
jgi:CHAT domain-containing protein/Tfp pilus assembly protein PilF